MKICHIKIENFRTFREFDQDIGRYNVFVGPNNTGKSNLLWAINCFYNPKLLSQEDIRKDPDGNRVADEFKIILTYDELNANEQRNNKKYYQNGKIKILLRGWIDENSKFKYEYHGYIQSPRLKFPPNFDESLKKLIEDTSPPKRGDLNDFNELLKITQEIQPRNKITNENWRKIKENFLIKHPDIIREQQEVLSPEKYQGFIETKRSDTVGECIFIPAKRDPSEALQTSSSKSPIVQLVQILLGDIESEEIKDDFQEFREKIIQEREQKKKVLEDKFKDELKLWNTTVNIHLKTFEINDVLPIDFDIFFNDGVLTDLERKGTGLQRYIFFKFLKISNELRLGENTSLILLFEEPEAHLHPQIQREIGGILREMSKYTNMQYQIFITTHSPQFIDMQNLDKVFIFNKKVKGCTEVNRCSLNLTSLKDFIKTILFFDANVSEIFFADRIVLIEGQSEEITANFLIQKGEIDVSNISIINAKSKDNIPTFLTVFNALKIPYSVMVDEDPYFLPYFSKTNPNSIKEKRRAYEKTIEIANQIDDSIGRLIVISPDFDNFLGISQNQIKKLGKPTATFKKVEKIFKNNNKKSEEIKKLFNLLLDPANLNYKLVRQDGTEWISEDESSVEVPKAKFSDFKVKLQNVLETYKEVINKMSENEYKEVLSLFTSLLKKSSKDKKLSK
ncbi:MAG: AAA family ATPase [Promethearchaeota archaeon]